MLQDHAARLLMSASYENDFKNFVPGTRVAEILSSKIRKESYHDDLT